MDRSGAPAFASFRWSGRKIRGGSVEAVEGEGSVDSGENRGDGDGYRYCSRAVDRGSAGTDDCAAFCADGKKALPHWISRRVSGESAVLSVY